MMIREWYLRKKFWITDFLNGGRMWKEYRDVLHIAGNHLLTNSGGGKRVEKILNFATENVAFYKAFKGCKLDDFPVINKQTILQLYEDFVTPVGLIPGQKGDVHIQKTSGSTGTPFAVYQDTRCRIRRIATIKAENEAIGFHSFMPMMHLRAAAHYWGKGKMIHYNKALNIYYVDNANLDNDKLQTIVDTINQNKIKFIRGYMTTLDFITQHAVKNKIKFSHHPTFISVGELMLESLRSRIVNDLHCHVISQYANEENGILGSSKIDQKGTSIWLNRANCIIEILKKDEDVPADKGELGRIVVTDFTNYAMPMIRYDIGDMASIGEVADDGTILRIDNLCGRKTDLIYKTNEESIDLFNSIPATIYNNPNIKQWQFIQQTDKNYTLKLNLFDKTCFDCKAIVKDLRDLLGQDAQIDVEYVDEIPILNSGKRKIIINAWKQIKQ